MMKHAFLLWAGAVALAVDTLKASNGLKLIPYCLWDNREPGNEMQCWFRTSD